MTGVKSLRMRGPSPSKPVDFEESSLFKCSITSKTLIFLMENSTLFGFFSLTKSCSLSKLGRLFF